MKKIILLVIIAAFITSPAFAISVAATLTADNHYGLFYGQSNGDGLTFVGRNEIGTAGSTGGYNWSKAETWNSSSVPDGSHAYVVAWDDGGPQGWIGQFVTSGGTLYTNTTDWEYWVFPRLNPGENGAVPDTAIIKSQIAAATWADPLAATLNGTGVWGGIEGDFEGIDANAYMIWHDTLAASSSSDNGYVIFRSKEPASSAIPEPMSMMLLGTGLLGLVGFRRKKR